MSLLDIYKEGCAGLNVKHDAPVSRYYEQLAAVQASGAQPSYQVNTNFLSHFSY